MNLSELLSLSIKEGASDLHLSAGLSPILRIDGDLVQTDLPIMNSDLCLLYTSPSPRDS